MQKFDINTVNLQGINLIEASAGTGKTFTLAELYCRLIIEHKLEVKQILVVTYTRAATEELRGRLRQRLVKERQDLVNADRPANLDAILRLKLAIQSFDEAAIYTIHGFCQRTLQDFAFESGYQFDMEMVNDEQDIKQAVADDFWRRHISLATGAVADYLLKKRQTPETLLNAVSHLSGKPYLQFMPLPEMAMETLQHEFIQQFEQVRQRWQNQREEAIEILKHKDVLDGNKYRKASVAVWIAEMDDLLTKPPSWELFERFNKFTQSELESSLKKNKKLPELLLWQACERLWELSQQLQTGYELVLQRLRLQLAEYLKTELPKRKQKLQVQAFDDLLLNLQQALHSEQGITLATKIREQFKAALIDEFQDTDPVQYDCFARIFADPNTPVFFVGDPKQAIYSFRGADIFTYLQAKQASHNEFNLDTNWRSHPLLVEAVNHLFERVDNAFVYDAIPFIPVNSARDNVASLTLSGQHQPPLNWLWLEQEGTTPANVSNMLQSAAETTANEIANRLNQAASEQAKLIDKDEQQRVINGGDIAVLVRSHKQAVLIQKALKRRGINSVQQSRQNVFESEQALMLERVLMAIATPHHDSRIATALATPIFNKTALDIYQAQHDESAWLQQTDFFVNLHEQWQQHGFIVMFRLLMNQLNVVSRWLQAVDGERQVTNLLHLAELIQAHARRRNSSMGAILIWLASQRQQGDRGNDAAQIRLESDEQLVKIITIHTSKGLEYPIVFCPFLWHAGKPPGKPAVMTYHRGEENQACVAFGEPAFAEAEIVVAQEERAESMRLLYVALTRAREQCVILWGAAKTADNSALFSLLHPALTKPDAAAMQQDLTTMVQANPQQMALTTVSANTMPVQVNALQTDVLLAARTFNRKLDKLWSIGSFSALTMGHHQEMPDHDAMLMPIITVEAEKRQDRFGFPKGANAGSCLHALFENWDFQTVEADRLQVISKTLNKFGIDEAWAPEVDLWLNDVVASPLMADDELMLKSIAMDQRLDEMEFYFPVSALTTARLKRCLLMFTDELPELEPLAQSLHFDTLTGFMKGFIDLIFEYKGKFYIADYKSNWLGNQFQHYQPHALTESMISHAYTLQYLIYTVALHRYLQRRIPDYDPQRHLGGVFYLFIRGMTANQPASGVYHAKPSMALITALDACMMETRDA